MRKPAAPIRKATISTCRLAALSAPASPRLSLHLPSRQKIVQRIIIPIGEETMMTPSRLANASHLTACAYAFAKTTRCLALSLAVLVLTGLSASAADDFYKGKTIKLV